MAASFRLRKEGGEEEEEEDLGNPFGAIGE